jgi:voltage-gated potassium channel
MPEPPDPQTRAVVAQERTEILDRLERWLETPMVVLGFVWLVLLVVELVRGLSPLLEALGTGIWIAFVLDFGLKLTLAPEKGAFLRRHWLTAVSLVLPALRVLRVFRLVRVLRAARAARGLRLVRVVTSVNRGMRALGSSMQRRGLPYVLGLTVLVVLGGSAGMYAFEQQHGLETYGEAL